MGVDLILPPRCPVNGDVVDAPGMISADLWAELEFISYPLCCNCGIPFDVGGDEEVSCLKCLTGNNYFDSGRSALRYNDASRSLILDFKHGDKMHVAKVFIPWLIKAGRGMFDDADILIPVPLHPFRLLVRRYNQAAILAYGVSKVCDVPYNPFILKRIRPTESQGRLGSDARMRNVSRAFDVAYKYKNKLVGRHVVLIDDVYTSGATLNECARVLKKYGVESVKVLTIARVVYED